MSSAVLASRDNPDTWVRKFPGLPATTLRLFASAEKAVSHIALDAELSAGCLSFDHGSRNPPSSLFLPPSLPPSCALLVPVTMSDGGARKAASKSSKPPLPPNVPLSRCTTSLPASANPRLTHSCANDPAFHFAAGLGSGVLSAVLLQPIDLLKTRVQQSGHHSLLQSLAEIRSSPRGLPALWRGTVPSALRTGFGSAIYFTTLNAIRQNVSRLSSAAAATTTLSASSSSSSSGAAAGAVQQQQQQQHSSSLVRLGPTANMLSGAAARAFAGLVLMPLTVIKVRYESSLYAYGSVLGAGRDILRAEGPRGFFAGFGATAIRDAPYAGFYVLFYEQSKRTLSRLYPTTTTATDENNSSSGGGKKMGMSRAAAINFSSGVLAATVCSVISNPFDAVKTRIQLQPAEYRNMAHAARRMLGEEGFRSMWDGLALRMSRKALSSALAWTLYEELIRRAEATLEKNRARRDVL
ncbi:uncharacterized protein E0L32_003063 [Thyridium curvatum]|uniref:Mitochondrial glycine transporter n=1 Tax=Thyridium curvatum TaxID=1093900 RepID=A0A507BL17_9PEZI|nr:uncharacterized protein E0L32_003063 [Thyridium curvatum]TPX17420.1 hypothetical protein E0L32_003063 [Thyridium curvatum]